MRLHEIVFIIGHSHGVLCFNVCGIVVVFNCEIYYLILSDCFVHTVLLSL